MRGRKNEATHPRETTPTGGRDTALTKEQMVPGAGIEPARCHQRQILSLVRLPVPPSRLTLRPSRTRGESSKTGPWGQQGLQAMRIIQLSDCHLLADPTAPFYGAIPPGARLASVVRAIPPGADLVLITGDLSEDGSADSYRQAEAGLRPLHLPVYALPGNHDSAVGMGAGLEGRPIWMLPMVIEAGWRLLMLDSSVEGAVEGRFSPEQLESLERNLNAEPSMPTLLCLHHHPVPLQSRWVDQIGLHQPEAFWEVVDRHPSVRAILFGHGHQAFDQWRGPIRLLGCPSTSVQFLPGSDHFAIDPTPPGFRWLDLAPDGSLTTGIVRVPDSPTDQP